MSYASRWESAPAPPPLHSPRREPTDAGPAELIALRERLREMPAAVRDALEPLVDDAVEQARFRGRALALARDAMAQLKLDLELTQFDLEVTRRERDAALGGASHE